MGETLGRFGIDPILLAGQILNFLIIGWILYRFLLKPLQANMKTPAAIEMLKTSARLWNSR